MPVLGDLLSKGYFPKELPPNFSTEAFGALISEELPAEFANIRPLTTHNCKHSFSRSRSFRRELMIINPIIQYQVCKTISGNWAEVTRLISRSNISTSKPVQKEESKRAFLPELERETLSQKRASLRSNSNFILKTDLSEFYHSIYTHSLPWAIHTKSFAKANRGNNYWGNLLDTWIRNGQDGQTIGIPVGPDSSLIIAEILMAAIDSEINTKIKKLKGLRYYDDYEFSFSSRSEAESALNVINNVVNDYGLRLNPIKTKILELPQRFEENWISKLRTYNFAWGPNRQKLDFTDYFDLCSEYYHQYPDSNVFTYAVARLKSEIIFEENWTYVQNILSQAMTVEPNVLPICFWLFLKHQDNGLEIDKKLLSECISNLIVRLAPLGHNHEIAWCLWGGMAFKLKISARATSAIEKIDDNVVAILAMDADAKGGIFPRRISKDNWRQSINRKSLHSENWLLAYESNLQGWLTEAETGDIFTDARFVLMRAENISFYTPLEYPVDKSCLEDHHNPRPYMDPENDFDDDYGWRDDD